MIKIQIREETAAQKEKKNLLKLSDWVASNKIPTVLKHYPMNRIIIQNKVIFLNFISLQL